MASNSPWRSSASSRPAQPTVGKGDAMSRKTVEHDIDLTNLPPLTAEQEGELEAPSGQAGQRHRLRRHSSPGRCVLEERRAQPALQADQDLDHGSPRHGRAALAAQPGQGVPRINAILRRAMLAAMKQ